MMVMVMVMMMMMMMMMMRFKSSMVMLMIMVMMMLMVMVMVVMMMMMIMIMIMIMIMRRRRRRRTTTTTLDSQAGPLPPNHYLLAPCQVDVPTLEVNVVTWWWCPGWATGNRHGPTWQVAASWVEEGAWCRQDLCSKQGEDLDMSELEKRSRDEGWWATFAPLSVLNYIFGPRYRVPCEMFRWDNISICGAALPPMGDS